MNESNQSTFTTLIEWFSKATIIVIMGIGNPLRRDDSIGTQIIQGLQGKVPENVKLIECQTVPENFIDKIISLNPSHILLLDAAILGLMPGDFRLIRSNQLMDFYAYSSHKLPLRIFCEYIDKMIPTNIALLLIEPGNVDFGEELTPQVDEAKQVIVRELAGLLS
jgi:hydrogenase 3 maturation protease